MHSLALRACIHQSRAARLWRVRLRFSTDELSALMMLYLEKHSRSLTHSEIASSDLGDRLGRAVASRLVLE